MDLAADHKKIHDLLFNGEVDIAVFVLDGKHYYVIVRKDNYCIDVRPEYDDYIQNGWLKPEQLDDALNSFRGGILLLDKNNFFEYIKIADVKCFTKSWMHAFLYTIKLKRIYVRSIHMLKIFFQPLMKKLALSGMHGDYGHPNFT